MAIEIRLLQNSEAELANNFFNEIYRTNRTIENFRWEFIDGPKGKAIYVIAVDTSEISFVKIVGIQCAIPLEFMRDDGSYILTAKSEDTLVHPGYRGQKLFERMYDLLFEACRKAGVQYIWGFTPALKAFVRLGFEAPFKTTQAVMVFKPLKAFNHLVRLNPANKLTDKFKISGFVLMSYLAGLKRFFIKSAGENLEEVTLTDKERTIKMFYPNSNLSFLRLNEAYLHWRLLKNPFGNRYRNLLGKTEPSADILINIRAEVSYLEQMLFRADLTFEHRQQFLRGALDKLAETGTPVVRAMCFENNEEMRGQIRLLRKIGFIHLNRGNYFVWKPLGADNSVSVGGIFFSRLFTQGNS